MQALSHTTLATCLLEMIVGATLAGRALPRRALRATILSNLRAPHPRIARAFSAVNPNVNDGAGSQGAANGRVRPDKQVLLLVPLASSVALTAGFTPWQASLLPRGAALAALGLGLYGLGQSQATQQEQKHKPLYPEFSKEEVRPWGLRPGSQADVLTSHGWMIVRSASTTRRSRASG
jgi:hypothetical protein